VVERCVEILLGAMMRLLWKSSRRYCVFYRDFEINGVNVVHKAYSTCSISCRCASKRRNAEGGSEAKRPRNGVPG
jgi:hypothetical protein